MASHLEMVFSVWAAVFAGLVALLWGWQVVRERRGGIAVRRLIMLEAVRGTALVLLLATLFRPEWVTALRRKSKGVVVVLHDASGSMATRDVVGVAGAAVARRDWIASRLTDRFYADLEPRYGVVVQAFDAAAEPTADRNVMPGTDLNAALVRVKEQNAELRAVILLSDGDWNAGDSPVGAALDLAAAEIPVFAVPVGSERHLPDLELDDVQAPAFCLLGEKVSIPFSIRSHLSREVSTVLSLRSADGTEVRKEVRIPPHSVQQDWILWHASERGEQELVLRMPVEREEVRPDNNTFLFRLAVREERLRVLLVEGRPRWEYRYLRNALSRDPGVDVFCVLLHPDGQPGEGRDYLPVFPSDRRALSGYDVVFLGDVPLGRGGLSVADATRLRGLVAEQGSGLVLMPGSAGRAATWRGTALEPLFPVVLDEAAPTGTRSVVPGRFALTTQGTGHLLTMLTDTPERNAALWRRLPGFTWHAAVVKARPGTQVLAVHRDVRNRWGRLPLLVTRTLGNGTVLFMGVDSAWRWRRGVEDKYHYRFWGQVVRWMAHKRHIADEEGVRLFFLPEKPRRGDTIFMHAAVFDRMGRPADDETVLLRIYRGAAEESGAKVRELQMTPTGAGWGVYRAAFVPPGSGAYTVRLECDRIGRHLTTAFRVEPRPRERVGRPIRRSVLSDMARISGGELVGPSTLQQAVTRIGELPPASIRVRRIRLWTTGWWAVCILSLFTLWWILRKRWGLV